MRHRRPIFSLLLLVALALSAAQFSPAHAARSVSGPAKVNLVINITTTGKTVWGWVWATWKSPQTQATMKKKCSKRQCTWSVPANVAVHFTEKARDSNTWPFSAWTAAAGGHVRRLVKTSFNLTMNESYTITATYVLV